MTKCIPCQKARKTPINKDLRLWSETSHPFERVHIDIAHHNEKNMLVLYDSFSSWGDVHIIQTLTSSDVVRALRSTFKYVLLPKMLVSDNGRCFLSSEFRTFCTLNKIEHVVTPPYHSSPMALQKNLLIHLRSSYTKTPALRFLSTY